MLGAIAGDIIGSHKEFAPIKTKDFPLFNDKSTFTDDTVLTIAVADNLLHGGDITESILKWGQKYLNVGYGQFFKTRLMSGKLEPYNSWGNGSAMRTSPIGFAYETLDEVIFRATEYAAVTHNHIEGIKGAVATSVAIFMAIKGDSIDEIKDYIENIVGYDLSRTVDEIRPTYKFEVSCQKSVPEAIICFLESTDYEDTIRNAVSLGGDADTQACIAGGIAEAYYGDVPKEIRQEVYKRLPKEMLDIVAKFYEKYI